MSLLVNRMAILTTVFLSVAALLAACGESSPTATQTPETSPLRTPVPGVEQTAIQTASYRIELWTGPALTMTMSFPNMSAMDQGQPVNRHLEIHVFDRSSGGKETGLIPSVSITDKATGVSRELAESRETGASLGVSFVTACLISKHREVEPHFGDNLYLPNGNYTITVGVGTETATAEISL
jgi:hypothetical protein